MGKDNVLLSLILSAIFVASCCAIEAVSKSETSYVIVTSDSVSPGGQLEIVVHLNDLITGPDTEQKGNVTEECILDLQVTSEKSLWQRVNWKIEVDKTPRSFSKTVRILTPTLDEMIQDVWMVTIESKSCFKFSHHFEIPTLWKEQLISIRTNKRIYNPSEFVSIECLVLSREHRPYRGNLNLTLYDENNTSVFSWINIATEEGIAKKQCRIPQLIREQEMRLAVEIHNQTAIHILKIRTIAGPYEKNLFIVDARVSKYHTVYADEEGKSKDLEVNILASHRSGLPIVGQVELVVSLENSTKSGRTELVELANGYKKMSLKMEQIRQLTGLPSRESLNGRKMDIRINVQETDVGEKDKLQSLLVVTKNVSVRFVDQFYFLAFTSSTPMFFKPGLLYIGHVMLKPIDEVDNLHPIETEVVISVKQFGPNSESPAVKNITLKVQPNSINEFSFPVSKEIKKIELEAVLEENENKIARARLDNILPFATSNKEGHIIQVTMKGPPNLVYVGEKLNVVITSTFPTERIHWELSCQQILVLAGNIFAPSPTMRHELSVTITQNVSHVLSLPNFVVWAITPSGELVADGLRFVVEKKQEQKLELIAKSEIVEPDSVVDVIVKGEPYTQVHSLILSDIVSFEKSELEMRKFIAQKKMLRYIHRLSHIDPDMCKDCSTFPSRSPDSARVYNESRSIILTNGLIFQDPSRQWPIPPSKNASLDDIESSTLDNIEEFSTLFWDKNYTIGESGELKLRVKVPKETRLYTISIFGLMPGKGLVVVDEPAQVVAASKVLASLMHPKSIVRGEETIVEIHLYNNQEEEAKVDVEVKENPKFKLVCLEGQTEKDQRTLRRLIVMKPRESRMLPVYIRSMKTIQEPLELEVNVTYKDVRHNLTALIPIEYEGYKVTLLETVAMGSFDKKQDLDLDIPSRIKNPIEKTESSRVTIYGHFLGPAIEHVCRGLDAPGIAEERSKLRFVLASVVLEHLANNSLFDDPIKVRYKNRPFNISLEIPVDREECIRSTRDSLHYLLSSKNSDGSYSFLPNSKGSISLTSMLLSVIVRLRNVRLLSQEEIEKTTSWLVSQQKEDGSFEDGKHSLNLRPYSMEVSEKVLLTSEVMVALVAVRNHLIIPKELTTSIHSVTKKGSEFIEKSILSGNHDKDPLALTSSTYALVLCKSSKVNEILLKRDSLAVREEKKTFWRSGLSTGKEEEEHCASCVASTSYALLTSLHMGAVLESSQFVNYVTSQMKPRGVFISTMDTLLALEALSEYHRRHNIFHDHDRVNVDVKVTLATEEEIFFKILNPLLVGTIRFDNSNITQSGPLKVETKGEGVIAVQSTVEYSESSPSAKPTDIDLNVKVETRDQKHLEVKVCAVNLRKEVGGVHIAEVPILSDYELNVEKIENEPNREIFYRNRTAYIIFSELSPSSQSCTKLELVKLRRSGRTEPRNVKLYSMLDPFKPALKPYKDESSESGISIAC